jgi:hypothetical protein
VVAADPCSCHASEVIRNLLLRYDGSCFIGSICLGLAGLLEQRSLFACMCVFQQRTYLVSSFIMQFIFPIVKILFLEEEVKFGRLKGGTGC